MKVKLEAGQWYRRRDGEIRYCIGPSMALNDECRYVVECRAGSRYSYPVSGKWLTGERVMASPADLIEHLPECNSFDWEPPKRPDAPEGWRWLEDREPIQKQDNFYNKGALTFPDEPVYDIGNTWEQISDDYKDIAWGVLRKIEPQYRQFTWDERGCLRDKWIKFLVDGQVKEMRISWFEEGPEGKYSINGYRAVWLFENATFLDGDKFGYRVRD